MLSGGVLYDLSVHPEDVLSLFRAAREAKGDSFGDACHAWLQRYVRFEVMVLAGETRRARACSRSPGTILSLDYDAPEHASEQHRAYREHLEHFRIPPGRRHLARGAAAPSSSATSCRSRSSTKPVASSSSPSRIRLRGRPKLHRNRRSARDRARHGAPSPHEPLRQGLHQSPRGSERRAGRVGGQGLQPAPPHILER